MILIGLLPPTPTSTSISTTTTAIFHSQKVAACTQPCGVHTCTHSRVCLKSEIHEIHASLTKRYRKSTRHLWLPALSMALVLAPEMSSRTNCESLALALALKCVAKGRPCVVAESRPFWSGTTAALSSQATSRRQHDTRKPCCRRETARCRCKF